MSSISHSDSCCLLSNRHYSVMLRTSGAGFSRWHGQAVTRWREDPVADPWGSYLLLRDEDDGTCWSATAQPHGVHMPDDSAQFSDGTASFSRRHHSIHSALDVAVASDADAELRRLIVSNHGDRTRSLSLTTYSELVLGPIGADNAHPAFSKMFVQTEWTPSPGLLLATRRRRDHDEAEIWAAHALQVKGHAVDAALEYETDRARFLGRGRTLRHALMMQPGTSLSGTVGCVLDPVFALRQRFTLAPGASVTLLAWTQLADSRNGAMTLTARLQNPQAAATLFEGARQHAESRLKDTGVDAAKAARCNHWLGALLYSDTSQRAAAAVLPLGHGGPPTLWAAGISGDRPIMLLCLDNLAALTHVEDVLAAQNHWREHGLAVDVVVLDTTSAAAGGVLQAALDPLVKTQQARLKASDGLPKAELFALRGADVSDDLRHGLTTVARVVLDTSALAASPPAHTVAAAVAIRATQPLEAHATADNDLEFDNGHGGFVDAGRAYRIRLDDPHGTPAPWVNVIANPVFGFLVSAEGGGYAWSLNSQQNPLTPWPNDPVSDSPHDVLYLRDEDTGVLWSACALPIRVPGANYTATHGKGWSRFVNNAHEIELELTQCVPTSDPVKLSRLRLCNRSTHARRLSVTGYVEWALGANGSTPAPFVISSRDERTGALFARNPWRADFADRVAFIDLAFIDLAESADSQPAHSISGDRAGFLGPLGDIAQPAALRDGTPLNGHLGAGLDPCGALQTRIELPPQTQLDLVFMLGDAADTASAQALIEKYRRSDFDAVLADVGALWNDVLDTVQVRTPDRAIDILLNDWLLYQVQSCRLWARTAYYQASGAYGFRDQLQDVMALYVTRPDLAREHLLRAAGRQFAEGDVQHWWLPPNGQGIRTRICDDRNWLVYVAMHYVQVTGDVALLDEVLPFLGGQSIPDDATDAFFQPNTTDEKVSVYEHCARALDSSLTRGAHGLPLIGTGDWNDGMNAVGAQGRGESSWMGWFLLSTIAAFTPFATQRGDSQRVQRWSDYASALRKALEQAWDGQWYRRGYYDDGAPLGSHESDECQIDTIAQSWSVLSGSPDRAHALQAMASVERMLVNHDARIACLFTPAFDHGKENPGYIKGYPAGVRENGGQYTHGAIWSVFAWAGLGDGDRAGAMFELLNPIHHSDNADAIARYKVEPYVACADVYSVAPHVGRGGWTWYSGSAAWLYRAGLEALLGFQLRGEKLRVDPCIPKNWPGFQLSYRHRGKQHATEYRIEVVNPAQVCRGVAQVEMDGQALVASDAIDLRDDGKAHRLLITLG